MSVYFYAFKIFELEGIHIMLKRPQTTGQVLSSQSVYNGPIFKVLQQTIKTPDGLTVHRDLVEHGEAVVMLAMTADRQQVLVNQEYRVGLNGEAIALPTGLIDPGEDLVTAAKRELAEETGYIASDLRLFTSMMASEGFTNERITAVMATIDPNQRTERHFDQDEFVTTNLVPFTDLVTAVRDGEVTSAQTIAAVSYYLAFIASAQ